MSQRDYSLEKWSIGLKPVVQSVKKLRDPKKMFVYITEKAFFETSLRAPMLLSPDPWLWAEGERSYTIDQELLMEIALSRSKAYSRTPATKHCDSHMRLQETLNKPNYMQRTVSYKDLAKHSTSVSATSLS